MVDRIIIFYGSRRDFEEIVEQETEDFEESNSVYGIDSTL